MHHVTNLKGHEAFGSLCLSLRQKKPKLQKDEGTKEMEGETEETATDTTRFSLVNDEESSLACQGVVPSNTKNSNDWPMRNLREWIQVRAGTDEPVPEALLSCPDATIVCKWFCRFVQETRKLVIQPHQFVAYWQHFSRYFKVTNCPIVFMTQVTPVSLI